VADDLLVIDPLGQWSCSECEGGGGLLKMEDGGPLCLACADLDHLVYLPRGDAALTRRARRGSDLSAVVVRFSRARRRYERQGVLVERGALEQAEADCLADAEARARRRERERERRGRADAEHVGRLTEAIRSLFPGCPGNRAAAIAGHTAVRGSGRVGRSAAARELDPTAIELAVAASVRHTETDYDELLMAGMERGEARATVRSELDRVLRRWRDAPEPPPS
jgi:hypothetical protein